MTVNKTREKQKSEELYACEVFLEFVIQYVSRWFILH